MKKLAVILFVLALALSVCAPAQAWWGRPHVVFSYGHMGYPGQYWGPYGPYGPGYSVVWNAGQVEIRTKAVGNRIIVDGGFAGRTGTLRKFWLRTGPHTIRVEDGHGKVVYREAIEVLAGKTLRLYPDGKS